MFPAFGLNNTDWRIVWDRSQVPALREDEQAKHSMIAADFKAGIIDRDEARVALGYESKPEHCGKFAVQTKAASGGEDDAIKSWEEWKHPRGNPANGGQFRSKVGGGEDGRKPGAVNPSTSTGSARPVNSGVGLGVRQVPIGSQGPFVDTLGHMLGDSSDAGGGKPSSQSPEEEANSLRLSAEWLARVAAKGDVFENAHAWMGDKLPPDSPNMQFAKHSVMRAIEPFARPGQNERSGTINVHTCKSSAIEEGGPTWSNVKVPSNDVDDPVVHFHSHPRDRNASDTDWSSFVTKKNVLEKHIVGPSTTYSLHKPAGWDRWGESTKEEVEETYGKFIDEFQDMSNIVDKEALLDAACDYATEKMCEKYGILFRKGIRFPEEMMPV